jgi:hypothetical protein
MGSAKVKAEGEMSDRVKRWTSDEDERLLDLKAKGLTLRMIAKSEPHRVVGRQQTYGATEGQGEMTDAVGLRVSTLVDGGRRHSPAWRIYRPCTSKKQSTDGRR